ncbi:MAG: HAD family hydrolase [Gemmatimonadales bacterium]
MSIPAVFLDRDGTLIEDPGYLSDPAGVQLLHGVGPALQELRAAGFALVVITNQSGIGRGLYTAADFAAVQHEVERQLLAEGIRLDLVLHCPHTADAGCQCRKPGTALYRQAMAALDLDATASWFIGDRPGDLLPTTVLGGNAILVRTGVGSRHTAEAERIGAHIALDLPAAVTHLRSVDRLPG